MDRSTPMKDGELITIGVAGSILLEAGKIIARNASGYAVEASDTAGLTVLGRGEERVDNSGGSDGDLTVTVRRGKSFKYKNSSSNPVTIASIGADVYVEDDETVAVAAGPTNDIVAGKLLEVESDGVWVYID